MKKQSRKISLKKVIISRINPIDMYHIKGGSSIPTDTEHGETDQDLGATGEDATHGQACTESQGR
ncbi:hypothetical protein [Kordia sp.]|uniref:hypothetical protein n=1 Tax=Kordia sp. TaxID=1965332 RepID=UPI0025C60238|nr:hypothetical protein [Kordia sp.]MCH2192609.1 hypothetical protein [Kordia sp.]